MYPVIQIEDDWVLDEEWMGTKTKFWVSRPDDSHPWLFKYSRKSGPVFAGEHWSEKLASEIAKMLGVPAADVELANYNDIPGCISRRFEELSLDGVALVHGNEILAGSVEGYDQTQGYGLKAHTLDNIRTTTQSLMLCSESKAEALLALGGLILLDALIVNVDRHHENWCVIRSFDGDGVNHRIGPSFDHASSLGRELAASRIETWLSSGMTDLGEKYVKKARGAIYWDSSSNKGTNPVELLKQAHQEWPEMIGPWLERLRGIDIDELCKLLDEVPDSCIEQHCRDFTADLLMYTYRELIEVGR